MSLRLRPLHPGDHAAAAAAHAELLPDNFVFLLHGWSPEQPWGQYLQRLEEWCSGSQPGLVPATFLVAEVDGHLVGRTSVRHHLNHQLRISGGHIGYAVRPAYRGRGYAHQILRQSLLVAGAHGVRRALLTCADRNLASRAVIERAGGQLEAVAAPRPGAAPERRYWVDVPQRLSLAEGEASDA